MAHIPRFLHSFCIIIQKKHIMFFKFFNKSVNRCLPRIRLRPAEKEGWSTIQICAAGKGLLGPWGWMAAVMRKQVHGQSERLAATLPNTLRQGQTTRLPGTCKNCLEGKATCLRKLVGLSFFFRYRTPLYWCQLSASQQAFQNFWHDPASQLAMKK